MKPTINNKISYMQQLLKGMILVGLLTASSPLWSQNINTPNKTGPMGLQVNSLTGNLYFSRNDLFISGRRFDLNISFQYNSVNSDLNFGYGLGWSFIYDVRYTSDTLNNKIITWGDGREDLYSTNGSGGYNAPKGFFTTFKEYQSGKFVLAEKDGDQYFFDNATHKRLTKMQEPNGNFLSFGYTDSLLTSVSNEAGQTINLAYDNKGRLITVTDALTTPNRTWNYSYDATGHLLQVTDPAGGKYQYTYLINGPMKSITDKNNNVVDIIYYGDATISELIGCNRRISFSYDTTQKVSIATDYVPGGEDQVTKYKYSIVNGSKWLTSITSNCCGFDKSFEYDNQGNKVKETDANGNVTTYTYDTLGNILTITDALQQTIKYTYTADFNKVASYTDAKGLVTRMEYDAKGNLTKITEPGNEVFTATYNSKGEVISNTDPRGNSYTYVYDGLGNPVSIDGPEGFHATINVNSRADVLFITDALGRTTVFEYDILSRIKKITRPLSQQSQLDYDAMGNPISMKFNNNGNSFLKFDASNRLVEYTDEMGKKTKATYDGVNNITSVTDAEGNKIQLSYDSKNRLTEFVDEELNKTRIGYDADRNVTSIDFANGQTFQYTYDVLNRIKTIGDKEGRFYDFTYDLNGNIIRFTDQLGAITQFEYDSLNRIKKIIDPLSNTILAGYDKNGNIVSLTDMNGHTSVIAYDNQDRVTNITDNNGSGTTATYNLVGKLLSLKDANNNITTYTYDSLYRPKRIIYPDTRFIEFAYDNRNNVVTKKMPDGSLISFTYDSLNRVLSKSLPDGQLFTYAYDNLGRVVAATNGNGTINLTYDPIGRLQSETFGGRTVTYQYDVKGRSQTVVYPDNTTVVKKYDVRNRLVTISRDNELLVTYQYNNADQVISKTLKNGITTVMQYDVAGRLSGILTGNGSIQNAQFSFDKNKNKTATNRLNVPGASEQFTYDNGNRLRTYKRGNSGGPFTTNSTYSYDALGNRTSAIVNGLNTNYTSNNLNQLINSNNGTQNINFAYDANGNMNFDGKYFKTYDAESRLIKDSANPANVLTYKYDAFGRRIVTNLNGSSFYIGYAGMEPVEVRDGNGIVKTRTIFNGFLRPVVNEKDGAVYYYHQNEMNSVEAITNSGGQLVESYEYDVWGKQKIFNANGQQVPGSVTGNRFGFTGQIYDSATATLKFPYREYNPDLGVFSQRDLIGYSDGMGMYQYVHNNPANGIDVMGLDGSSAWDTYLDIAGNYISNFSSIAPALTETGTPGAFNFLKVSQNVANSRVTSVLNSPLWTVIATPANIAGTIMTANDIRKNWNCKDDAQKMDASMNLASGTYFSITGILTSKATLTGLYEGYQNAQYLKMFNPSNVTRLSSLKEILRMGTLRGGSVLGRGNLALSGGLSLAALANMAWKAKTGETFAETGAHGEGFVADWDRASWQNQSDEQTMEDFNNQNASGRARDYQRARAKVDKLGSHGPVQQHHWNARHPNDDPEQKKDCPQNNGGGSQKPGGGKGPDDSTHVISGLDPNEIIGPDGQPAKRWVSVKDRLPYTVLFENAKEATAPAKFVKVTVPVHDKMDAAQFELKNFGFNNQSFTVPASTAAYYQRLDCRDSIGLFVDITAGYDVSKNQFFWEFQSIDPLTLLPPANPLKGFLQQQDSTKTLYGHGFVNFSVKPVANAHTLDSILAKAAIVFDTNDTIPTNITHNIIDAVAPTSNLNDLGANYTGSIPLTWNGADDANGSGLRHYTLYVSTDGINFNIIRSGMTRTDTVFNGTPGSKYYFFVLATDTVGNVETLRPGAIKSTQLGAGLPLSWLYFNGTAKAKDNVLDWATASEQNVKEFQVERSFDGYSFEAAGKVKAVGNSSRKVTYQFIDANVDRFNKKVFYYRLKQMDIDGNSTYSRIVRLNHDLNGAPTIVYPNPTNGYITIVVGDPKLIGTNALVFDEVGRMIQSVKITANAQTINLATQMNGVYIIRLENKEILRVVKQ